MAETVAEATVLGKEGKGVTDGGSEDAHVLAERKGMRRMELMHLVSVWLQAETAARSVLRAGDGDG
jgi:hypothetical protein